MSHSVSKIIKILKMSDLINIIPKKDFKTIWIHEQIKIPSYFKDPSIFGTYIDICIRYIYDNSNLSPINYLKFCNIYPTLPNDIILSDNNDKVMNYTICNDFPKIMKFGLEKIFNNIKIVGNLINYQLDINWSPDLICDDTIIEIKAYSKSSGKKYKNFLQIFMYYLLDPNIKNIGIYNPLKGELYLMNISNEIFNNKSDILNSLMRIYKNKIKQK